MAKGQLKKRVTLIPLNKINAFVAGAEKIGAAQKLAPGKVDLALTLVGYDDEVSRAMEYVFGNTLICADAATAKRVTFDNAVRMKSVTLDGDVYDPAGTLSGGSKPNSGNVLVKMQDLIKIDRALKEAKTELGKVESQMQAAKAQMASFSKAKRDLDLKRHQVTLLESQISGSNATRIIGEVEKAKASIAELKEAINAAKQRQQDASKEAKRLEREMDEFEKNKDSKLDQLKPRSSKRKPKYRNAAVRSRLVKVKYVLWSSSSNRLVSRSQPARRPSRMVNEQSGRSKPSYLKCKPSSKIFSLMWTSRSQAHTGARDAFWLR